MSRPVGAASVSGGTRADGADAAPGGPVLSAERVAAARGALRGARRARRRRDLVVLLVLGVLVVGLAVVAMVVGDYPLSLRDVATALLGREDGTASFVVLGLRLPRVLTGLVVGTCFGVSGALLQSLLRNPLASPDLIGISSGASAAAVLAILVGGLSGLAVSGVAFGGALLAALVIWVLASRGGVSGYRFVLVGIGVAAVLNAVVSYVLTRTEVTQAQQALVWLTGSLNASTWGALRPLLVCAAVLLPVALALGRALRGLAVGDDAASGLGVRVQPAKLAVLVVAVALAAVATAAAGPVAFVALVSAPVARRLLPGRQALPAAALVGAAVVLAADLVAQHTPSVPQLPVGVVTGVVGAPYLLWLLSRGARGRG